MPNEYVILDTETTGLNFNTARVIEIGAIKISNGDVVEEFDELIASVDYLAPFTVKLTGITIEDLNERGKKPLETFKTFRNFIGDLPIVAHNARFDHNFLNAELVRYGLELINNPQICTLKMARKSLPMLLNHKLTTIKSHFDLDLESHRALADSLVCLEIIKNNKKPVRVEHKTYSSDDYSPVTKQFDLFI